MSDSAPLWRETPLIYSKHLSDRLGSSEYSVYLKLENLQPAHSFKSRGLSHFIKRKLEEHGPGLHAICASGGNAGLAAAAASQTLGVRCTIYLPEGVDSATRKYLAALGAKDVVVGSRYAEALVAAKNAVAEDADAVLIPAYEDRLIWEGHSTMVSEMKKQLNREPDAIFCSVGGAGLLGGIILGCRAESWDSVPIIAMETHGSNCFFETMAANRGEELASPENTTLRTDEASGVKIAHLSRLTSKAASLGASEATAGAVRLALDRPGGVRCATIPDEMSMQVSKAFADDHKILAELACATALAPAYSPKLMSCLVPPVQGRSRVVIFVVCGGFKISVDDLSMYAEAVKEDSSDAWMVRVDGGRQMTVSKLP